MSDDYRSEEEKQKEIDDFFHRFDQISTDFEKQSEAAQEEPSAAEGKEEGETIPGVTPSRVSRREKSNPTMNKKKTKRQKKQKINKKTVLRNILIVCAVFVIGILGWALFTISKAPHIDSDNLYSMLSENSTIYDASGEIVETLYAEGAGLRTNISYTEMPEQLVNAFIAIEDKTFREHHGFNFIRIFGAIFDSLTSGESVKGTSTITQQLARNLYLEDRKSERSLSRKLMEAYLAVQLEKQLNKDQIIEAYLNTIYMGSNSNGVAAAAETYFSKDVSELNLAECAVLASIPKHPTKYSPLITYNNSDITDPDAFDILLKDDSYTVCYQDQFSDRQHLVLKNMLEQEMISQAEYDEAMAVDIRESINPNMDPSANISSFFADYVVDQVVEDLMKELKIDEGAAKEMIYTGGLRINSTLDLDVQKSVENAFSKTSNFPGVTGYSKDSRSNIKKKNGGVLLYSYANMLDDDGNFLLKKDEYKKNADGSVTVLKGNRLNFYKTEVQGNVDISVELKSMYRTADGLFYTIPGGYFLIPSEYKSKDEDGNLVLSASFFEKESIFNPEENGSYRVPAKYIQLQQTILQPQAAMVIMDYKTGGIKAMAGGRDVNGKQLFNRATSPRQPGSSIKPLGVYGPALQSTANKVIDSEDSEDAKLTGSGTAWTAASVVEDKPLNINGKQWPKNWYSGFRGPYTLRRAVEQSVNTVAVRVQTDIGADTSAYYLKKLGITSLAEDGDVNDMNPAALALGGMSSGISPLEMAAAYGTFPNKGVYTEPVAYTSVTTKQGDILLEKKAKTEEVFDPGVAFIMTDILRTTVSKGIAGAAGFGGQPVAGKTGTTTDNFDAWFVGFTPYYSAALWIGNDINIELTTGSGAAASLWSKIMKEVHSGLSYGSYPSAPSNVVAIGIDSVTGLLPNEETEADPNASVIQEYFIRGTQPTISGTGRQVYTICLDSGYLATPYCTNTETLVIRSGANSQEEDGGKYTYYCNLHNNDAETYPISPGLALDPNFIPPEDPEEEGGESDPNNPNNPGNPNNPDLPQPQDPNQSGQNGGVIRDQL